jgi:ADP-ribose pyrophosphatase
MQPWKTLRRETILNQPPWLVVEHHEVMLPDGRVIPDWPWVITPDYVNVVAETEQGTFLCFRQVKYGLAGTSLAVVGGYIAPGEEPLAAARRELLEETGFHAAAWIPLGCYRVDPNRGMAVGHLYLARGVHRTADPVADDLEEQELLTLTRAELESALDRGEFKVLAWASAVALALRYLSTTERR